MGLALASDENVQYLAMALVWLFSPQYPLAMLPFGIYSVFHVATYTRTNLIPTLQPAQSAAPAAGASPSAKATTKPNATADTIGKFVKEYYDASMGLVALLEILVGAQSTSPAARTVWDGVKGGARTFHDATDVGKYVGGAPAQKKAS